MFIIKDQFGRNRTVFEICDESYSQYSSKEMFKCSLLNAYVRYLTEKDDTITTIPTDIEELDKIIGGGLTSGLYVIGANPGIGKTSLLLHIAINLALKGKYSLFFNLEMSEIQIIVKLLANVAYRLSKGDDKYSKFNISKLLSKSLYNHESKKIDDDVLSLVNNYKEIIDNYINIITYNQINNCRFIESIGTALKNYTNKYNIRPVVMVDFLQLLNSKEDINNDDVVQIPSRRTEIDKIISKLKMYSNTFKVPIIVISSLSRSGYTKSEDADLENDYSLSIFKESGQIEYTADFIALLTKNIKEDPFDVSDQETLFINILKNRYGKTGSKIPITFFPEYSCFSNKDTE